MISPFFRLTRQQGQYIAYCTPLRTFRKAFTTSNILMGDLKTYRDVLKDKKITKKVSHENPLPSESYIKFEQPWPANEDKKDSEKDSEASKEGKSDSAGFQEALKEINARDVFNIDKYTPVVFVCRKELNTDVRTYTFKHSLKSIAQMNIEIGQHILCGFMTETGIIERPYAIASPSGADKDDGHITIVAKTYFPTETDPGGSVSNILDCLDSERHDEMLIRGPEGPVRYMGNGTFRVDHTDKDGKVQPTECKVKKINFISGGTGMTPIYTVIRGILETDDSKDIEVKFIDANVDQKEILLEDHLNELADQNDRFDVVHVLEKPGKNWSGEVGLIDEEKLKKHMFKSADDTVSLICGPPPMQKVAKEGLEAMGFKFGTTMFCF